MGDLTGGDCLDHNDHEIAEFKILAVERKDVSRVALLNFKRANFKLLFGIFPGNLLCRDLITFWIPAFNFAGASNPTCVITSQTNKTEDWPAWTGNYSWNLGRKRKHIISENHASQGELQFTFTGRKHEKPKLSLSWHWLEWCQTIKRLLKISWNQEETTGMILDEDDCLTNRNEEKLEAFITFSF